MIRRVLLAGPVAVVAPVVAAAAGIGLALAPAVHTDVNTGRTEITVNEPEFGTANPLVPCPAEDMGRYCLWDARVRGNGLGRSFVRDGYDRVIYLPWPFDGRRS